MSKSELLVSLAQIPDGDPRLDAVFAAIAGKSEPDRPQSVRLWKMGQAAKEVTMSRCTLWRAIKDGRLKSIEIRRGSHRIPDAELRRFAGGK